MDGIRPSEVVSILSLVAVQSVFSDGGGDESLFGMDEVETVCPSMEEGTGECAGRRVVALLRLMPSSQLNGVEVRMKWGEIGRGVVGKAGTGGGVVPSLGVPLRATEGERERRRKNGFFFLVDASDW